MINGKGQLTYFEKNLVGTTYVKEFKIILTYMDHLANLNSLPDSKFKDITPKKETVKEFEFKSKHLRCYCIKTNHGKIVMMCGFKNTQKGDIKAFRSLKQHYINSIK